MVTDGEYFNWWHEAQYARQRYLEGPRLKSNREWFWMDDQQHAWSSIIGLFLDEYNRRHERPITVDEFIGGGRHGQNGKQQIWPGQPHRSALLGRLGTSA